MEVHFGTDTGLRYQTNEDFVAIFNNQKQVALYILCDGVGGHQSGEIASYMTVHYIGAKWENTSDLTINQTQNWLEETIQEVNQLIYEKASTQNDLNGMSTTLVCLIIQQNHALIAHVGDSRAYLYRHTQLTQLTNDHSLVNELLKEGVITENQAQTHQMKHVITQAIGSKQKVNIDYCQIPLENEDLLFLCSDGLTDMISNEELATLLKNEQSLDKYTMEWIELANLAGGHDNISVLFVRYQSNVLKGDV